MLKNILAVIGAVTVAAVAYVAFSDHVIVKIEPDEEGPEDPEEPEEPDNPPDLPEEPEEPEEPTGDYFYFGGKKVYVVEEMPKRTYDSSLFQVNENGFLTYDSDKYTSRSSSHRQRQR